MNIFSNIYYIGYIIDYPTIISLYASATWAVLVTVVIELNASKLIMTIFSAALEDDVNTLQHIKYK